MSRPARSVVSGSAVRLVAAVLLAAGLGVSVFGVIALRSITVVPAPHSARPVSAFTTPGTQRAADPMWESITLIDYLIVGGVVLAAVGAVLLARGRWPAHVTVVKVRCQSCRTLSDEAAKFCSECGHAV